jgi:hypothetical protein
MWDRAIWAALDEADGTVGRVTAYVPRT